MEVSWRGQPGDASDTESADRGSEVGMAGLCGAGGES